MITMSYQTSGSAPPLPKRSTSMRQPGLPTHQSSHTPVLSKHSNSLDIPPPLPPHHPEPNTLPRKKSETDFPPKNQNAPELPSRDGRRSSEGSHIIQRKAFETNSFIDRHTAKIFSDPERLNKSTKIRHSDSQSTRPPAVPPTKTESSSKQSIQERRLPPPPPSVDTIPPAERRRPSLSDPASYHDLPPPPPPSTQSIPSSTKQHHMPAVFEAPSLSPLPTSPRQPNTVHVKLEMTNDIPPPLPPARNRSLSSTSQGSQHSTSNIQDFEKRFFFHDVKEFPKPEKFSNGKKTYPSQAIAEKRASSIGAL